MVDRSINHRNRPVMKITRSYEDVAAGDHPIKEFTGITKLIVYVPDGDFELNGIIVDLDHPVTNPDQPDHVTDVLLIPIEIDLNGIEFDVREWDQLINTAATTKRIYYTVEKDCGPPIAWPTFQCPRCP